mmetsp:Transcript_9293/g.10593  ORF Transcript_9293/g.10593 Transcript_9293/m.10593 type:complete len:451 (+) Transcript_9293:228-1580(+)
MSFLSEVKVKTESKFSQWDLCGSSLQESDVDNLMRGDLLAFDIDAEMVPVNEELESVFLDSRMALPVGISDAETYGEVTANLSNVRIVGSKSKRNEEKKLKRERTEVASAESSRQGKVLSSVHMPGFEPSTVASSRDIDLLDDNYRALKELNDANSSLKFVVEPPLEVRTRTKNENRTFGCSLSLNLLSLVEELGIKQASCVVGSYALLSVKLVYAKDTTTTLPILGGTRSQKIDLFEGNLSCFDVEFNDLSVSVASPKHSEREFSLAVCIEEITIPGVSQPLKNRSIVQSCVYSRPFYAFSHKSVLKRRKAVTIRATSHDSCDSGGGMSMHVVGAPFVRSDRLQCVFKIKAEHYNKYCRVDEHENQRDIVSENEQWVSLKAQNLEFFSDSVLFFNVPTDLGDAPTEDIPAYIQITNDGRNFSNALEFTFTKSDSSSSSPNKRPRIMSRM